MARPAAREAVAWARIRADIRALRVDGMSSRHLPGLHDQSTHGRPLGKLIDAALKWKPSDGGDDPIGQYTREQLRKVAKAKGIELPKGATKEQIIQALKDAPALDLPKPKVPAKKTATVKKSPLGTGTEIAHIPDSLQKLVYAAYKSQPKGQLLSHPAELSYDNMYAIAHVYGAKVDGGLSVGQIAKIVDAQLAEAQKVTNHKFLEKKIKDWLGTSAGASYAQGVSKPDKSVIDSVTGKLSTPKGVKLKPGQRVQRVSGPGGYKEPPKPGDFTAISSPQATAAQGKLFAKLGVKLSSGQQAALHSYTGGGYTGMNDWLRGKVDTTTSAVKQQVVDLQSTMLPIEQDIKLVRGTGWDQLPPQFRTPATVAKLLGKTIQDPGFVSTSVAGSGGSFAGHVRMEIEAPVGTPGLFVRPWSVHQGENEFLLAAGSKFKVLAVQAPPPNPAVVKVRVVTPK